jgi:anthranilate 1,2-dioxygenase small subunit
MSSSLAVAAEIETPLDPKAAREARFEIEEFHTAYCNTLDCGLIDAWPDYFTDDAIYRVTARENADLGLPDGVVYAEGKGMLKDRAYAIGHTEMFAPRYMRHFVSNVLVTRLDKTEIEAQSNYMLLQTLLDGPTTIHQAGRYYDRFVRKGGLLLLKERQCVYDTLIIPNVLVFPV